MEQSQRGADQVEGFSIWDLVQQRQESEQRSNGEVEQQKYGSEHGKGRFGVSSRPWARINAVQIQSAES